MTEMQEIKKIDQKIGMKFWIDFQELLEEMLSIETITLELKKIWLKIFGNGMIM